MRPMQGMDPTRHRESGSDVASGSWATAAARGEGAPQSGTDTHAGTDATQDTTQADEARVEDDPAEATEDPGAATAAPDALPTLDDLFASAQGASCSIDGVCD